MAKGYSMATLKWRKESIKRYEFYLHKEINKELLEWLDLQPNKREYIIKLIQEDYDEHKKSLNKKD